MLDGLRKVFKEAKGRVLLTTFASNIHRLQQAMEAAAETGRKVAVVGRRMEQNLEICSQLNYVRIPKGVLVRLDELRNYPDHEVAILTTGSQGEPMSALVQMSKGSYGRMQIKDGDTLVYSARPIPGNEGAIWRTINRLFEQGCTVVYDAPTPIHVSGHAYQEELKMMINLTKPYYVAPVHGEPRHQFIYNNMARTMGYPEHRIFTMKSGIPLAIDETQAHFGAQVPVGQTLVDGSGREGVTDDVLRDRFTVAKEGLVSVTVVIDKENGRVVGEPIVQARGFHGPDDMESPSRELDRGRAPSARSRGAQGHHPGQAHGGRLRPPYLPEASAVPAAGGADRRRGLIRRSGGETAGEANLPCRTRPACRPASSPSSRGANGGSASRRGFGSRCPRPSSEVRSGGAFRWGPAGRP